jgi:hypothetical protein
MKLIHIEQKKGLLWPFKKIQGLNWTIVSNLGTILSITVFTLFFSCKRHLTIVCCGKAFLVKNATLIKIICGFCKLLIGEDLPLQLTLVWKCVRRASEATTQHTGIPPHFPNLIGSLHDLCNAELRKRQIRISGFICTTIFIEFYQVFLFVLNLWILGEEVPVIHCLVRR